MTASQLISLRGPFEAIEQIESALEICEREFCAEVSSVTDITPTPARDRVVLLVEFTGGLKIKLSVSIWNYPDFHEMKRFCEAIGIESFSRVLLIGDGWGALEWIAGQTLRERSVDDRIVREAARLLWTIHRTSIDGNAETVLHEAQLKLEARLATLVSHDLVSKSESQLIRDMGDSIAPHSLTVSLIHGDFSPDNLVISDGAALISVDNDRIRLHVTAYDVVRAVTLWDEYNLPGRALFDAYVELSGRKFTSESLFFWSVFDLVYRIGYRIESFGEFNEFCINRLRQMLNTGAFR